jgi:hypothetical protein
LNLNSADPAHIALIELAFAAAQLVEDLHDYQHFLGGRDDWPFSLDDVAKHYELITVAWERFRAATATAAVQAVPAQTVSGALPSQSEEA